MSDVKDPTFRPNLDHRWAETLAPYRNPILTMKVKCSCGNTLGLAYPAPGLPMVAIDRRTTASMSEHPRSWIGAELIDGIMFEQGGRLRLTCSPKCSRGRPRRWVFDAEGLTTSFVTAARAGRRVLVLGDNGPWSARPPGLRL